jgi:asparagine synthase (glutamine-hydrolysing)
VPLYLLSRAVHQSGLKVVLTGEGADEVFGGYDIFREAKVRQFWAKRPDSKFRHLLLGKLHPYILHDPKLKNALQSFFGKGIDQPAHPFFSHTLRWQNMSRAKTFFSAELREATQRYDGYDEWRRALPEKFSSWDYLAKAQYLEMKTLLGNFLLSSQGDRMAMAHAVETRMPFLDHRLIELMASVPAKCKIKGMQEKYVLRKILRSSLPEKIVNRQKHPYRAPIKPALLRDDVPEIREMLLPTSLQGAGLFDPEKVQKLLRKLERSPQASEFEGMALTGIVSSQLLYQRFINAPVAASHDKILMTRLIDRRSYRDNRHGHV